MAFTRWTGSPLSTCIGVEGTGVVGARVARELASTAATSVVLLSGSQSRRRDLMSALGPTVVATDDAGAADLGLDTVVLVTPETTQPDLADRHLRQGRNVVATASSLEAIERLLELESVAREVGRHVVVGACFSPGVSTTLAVHAAALFEEVLEVRTGFVGWAGEQCELERRAELKRPGREWRDGAWHEVRPGGLKELLWFPEPIGARDCGTGALGEALLMHRVLPEAQRVVGRAALPRRTPMRQRIARRGPMLDDPGAIRVEVRGVRGGVTDSVIYGALERPSSATAVVAAVAALSIAGTHAQPRVPSGVVAVPSLGSPVELLTEWGRRGLRACVFEGSIA